MNNIFNNDVIIEKSNISIGSGNMFTFTDDSGTTKTSTNAFAQGTDCSAIGLNSHAQGIDSMANGRCSHAEGLETRANGDYSHAEGGGTTTNSTFSHAEGDSTVANGMYSHVEGCNTIANNSAEHANGAYNVSISGTSQDLIALTADTQATLFSVGNGVNEQNRRNAFEIKYNGDSYFSGDTKFAKSITADTITANTITSPTIDALANKQYVDDAITTVVNAVNQTLMEAY